mmetsp:Transcript_34195/g.72858  ORF Transcript_34195/g.72858 Transcript_34195/m.72858 type:complete len:412 (+) Transcript_34195:60-1295(+)|eukprot:CAMPEP_0172572630 /NCGR_PEP_ID=MMETSP1067-20121228/135763_1 /TAXON_ID=265564 ORGANISM="Thalassiosira punctigera, Strain Tpunct2005C2" /NCGR_SAMPLE_ID=MMETSP1067 /ASSEMBLY_ACC=CAM_ASM_000444 /LENGTH=411 /DNA_ID=CAMNT_0013365213 /DNA_START=1 /DNA_END=1236 /DNA_ORIENTATION=+
MASTARSSTQEEQQRQYCSRKPKWWTQLSGRRGTRGQRQAIQRMTHRGYCLPKDVLTDFSRVNNRARQNSAHGHVDESDRSFISTRRHGCKNHEWRRTWWNRALGIAGNETEVESLCATNADAGIGTTSNNAMAAAASKRGDKHSHKIHQMYSYKNPLPPKKYEQVWLEIGFGNGDNLLANANNHPDALCIGCEIHQPGVGTLLRQMEISLGYLDGAADSQKRRGAQAADGNNDRGDSSQGEENVALVALNGEPPMQLSPSLRRAPGEKSCQNIRILPGDGIKLLSHLPTNYLNVMLITFPDPWPRDCHAHWRVVQREVVREMHRILKSFGRVYVVTDAECFDEWTREIFRKESSSFNLLDGNCGDSTPATLWNEIKPCPDRASWLPEVSYYENKGIEEGRCAMLQCWQRL